MMQYEVKDTVGFPVVAKVDVPLRKFNADGSAITVETISAGQRAGFSSGLSREIETATKGKITIIHLQDDGYGGGDVWADLSKVYFTTDFGFGEDEIKHSVKGSANFDKTVTEKVTPKIIEDNNTKDKETREKIIEGAGKVLDIITGKPTVKPAPIVKKDDDESQQMDWSKYLKWGLIGLAVVGSIILTVYLVKDKPVTVNSATPQNDVPTLQGVNIPHPKKLT